MLKRIFLPALFFSVFLVLSYSSFAQVPTWTIDLLDKEKKPEKFENRKLGSEKMAEKKFTLVRNFFQNNFTHYNYYYNAKNKINTVIERAKAGQKDDYSKLLSYYPYSLENTATQKSELDSVIFKATAGILLHDLRNDWIDNMYLLMGKAFYYRKEFDSAAATFQFINYNLFPRKKHEDDSRVVGTTDAASNSAMSIANKEKQNILQKVAALPPSRNDALIWMARTLIEQNEMSESGGLINTLQHDPNLPKRLQNDLDDVNAYWFYKQQIYDSSANYLERALSTAENNADLARSEFLLAQLYEITNQFDKASSFYDRVSTHTVDPMMDINARLNNAKMLKSSNPEALTISINHLVGMSKKDRFEAYRDIIFYSAGELAMQKPDSNAAVEYFNKSVAFNENNISYKNKAFLALADIAYSRKQYKAAFAFYDSLQSGDTTLNSRLADIQSRRDVLAKMVAKIVIIEREDSLQHIAAIPAPERENYLKKMVRRLRKEKGLKDEEKNGSIGSAIISFDNMGDNKKNDAVDLFAAGNKGEWYFYNNAAKANGINEFKRKWGPRKNVDNWQRKNAPESSGAGDNAINPANGLNNTSPDDIDKPVDPNRVSANQEKDFSSQSDGSNPNDITQIEDISYDGLMSGLPLTPEKMHNSHTLIATNVFELAKLLQEELEDYRQAISTYDESLSRYPDSLYDGELYLRLYFCYSKLGYADKAAYYKNLVNKNFASSHSALILNNPAAADPRSKNSEGTKRYEAIYNMFIEGNFDQAFAEKRKADSIYGNNYWSPQLLYIEAVYHIKQQKDSVAISVLNNILSLYPGSKLAPKAERMIDVLNRRAQIEEYLSKLQITRAKDDEIVKIDERTVLKRNDLNLIKPPVRNVDTTKTQIKASALKIKDSLKVAVIKDTVKTIVPPPAKPVVKDTVKVVSPPVTKDTAKAIVLIPLAKPVLKDTVKVVSPPVANDTAKAIVLIPLAKPVAKDSGKIANPPVKDTAKALVLIPLANPAVKDSVKKATTVFVSGPFTMDVESPHNVIMLMNKVDVTYVNESKNAFNRYLSQNFRDDSIALTRDALDKDRALLVFASFPDAASAYSFLMKIKKAAPDEVSWLPANKYSFYLINDENLQLLKTNKDLAAYIGLLNKVYPGKF